MSDIAGVVVWIADYRPFGVATVNEDPDGDGILVKNNFRFPGQYYDAETGLNYNYFRTYDPLVGRYTQSDPIGLRGGLNSFGYVNGDPVNFVDLTGEASVGARLLRGFLGKLEIRHMYIEFENGTTWGVYPTWENGKLVGEPRWNNPLDKGGRKRQICQKNNGTPAPDPITVDTDILKAIGRYRIKVYLPLGFNSNTAVRDILEGAGYQLPDGLGFAP
jgi:RHS repeat-associated protein